MENVEEKNPPGSTIFFLSIWEENWEEKRERGGLTLKLHIYPLLDVLWELACLTCELGS